MKLQTKLIYTLLIHYCLEECRTAVETVGKYVNILSYSASVGVTVFISGEKRMLCPIAIDNWLSLCIIWGCPLDLYLHPLEVCRSAFATS